MTTQQAILGVIPDPHFNAIINVELTSGWICKLEDDFFKDYQLTRQQYNILRILKGQYPKAAKIKDIRRRMIDKMSNVGRLVEKLLQKGFVEKVENEHDRRVVFVQLTDIGMNTLSNVLENLDVMHSHFDNITKEEADELVRILEKMRAEKIIRN